MLFSPEWEVYRGGKSRQRGCEKPLEKNPICETARPTSFVYVTPKGFPAAVPLPIQACLFCKAESGSGGGDFGKVAFVNCELTFVVHEIPKE